MPELLSDGDMLYLVGHDTLGWTYALPDALGSVRQEVDAAGALLDAREWTPYGVEQGGAQPGLGYTGEWFDAVVGLEYLRARWYDAGTGRFTSRDPWKGKRREPLSLNPYIYVLGNPILQIDPSGLYPVCGCGWPGCCGPDMTEWFMEEVRLHWEWVDQEIRGDVSLPNPWTPPLRAAQSMMNLNTFANYAKAIPYKWMNFRKLASGSNCPSQYTTRCRNSVTLCGKCINREELGNIMFGIAGKVAGTAGISADLLYGAARNVGALAKPWDQAAAGVGYHLATVSSLPPVTSREMCDSLKTSHGKWPAYVPPGYLGVLEGRVPLSQSFESGADWNWEDVTDPTRADGCKPCSIQPKNSTPHTTPTVAGAPHHHPYAGAPDYEYYDDQIPEGMLDPDYGVRYYDDYSN